MPVLFLRRFRTSCHSYCYVKFLFFLFFCFYFLFKGQNNSGALETAWQTIRKTELVKKAKYENVIKVLSSFLYRSFLPFWKHLFSLHSCEVASSLFYRYPVMIDLGIDEKTLCLSISHFASSCYQILECFFKTEDLHISLKAVFQHTTMPVYHPTSALKFYIY